MSRLLIDSSGWVEFFAAGKKSKEYRRYILSPQEIITPSLLLYEVYKKFARERSEAEGIFAIIQIQSRSAYIIPLDESLAIHAADISIKWRLAMADAIIYATTLKEGATLITSDHHFEGLDNVTLI